MTYLERTIAVRVLNSHGSSSPNVWKLVMLAWISFAHDRMNFVEVFDCSNSAYQTFLKALAAHVR